MQRLRLRCVLYFRLACMLRVRGTMLVNLNLFTGWDDSLSSMMKQFNYCGQNMKLIMNNKASESYFDATVLIESGFIVTSAIVCFTFP